MAKQKSFDQKFWEDAHGRVVVWQSPNKWLAGWFIGMVINWFVPFGLVHRIVGTVSFVALVVWALLEVTQGVNYFRRTIGLLVILLLILTRFI